MADHRKGDTERLISDPSLYPTADLPSTNRPLDDDDVSITTEVSVKPSPGYLTFCGIKISLQVINAILAVITVITNVGLIVCLPIYAKSLDTKSDVYSIIVFTAFWFPIILFGIALIQKLAFEPDLIFLPWKLWKFISVAGVMNAINALLMVFTSDPQRTPAYLQAILMTTTIPFTVVCRYMMLRQGVSFRRGVCTGIVMIGLFITLEPQIWDMDGSTSSVVQKNTLLQRILYPLLYAISFIPVAIVTVIWEKEMKEDNSSSVVFMAWTNVIQCVVLMLLWWTDLIPEFGMAHSVEDFWDKVKAGFNCHFGQDPTCSDVMARSALFMFFYITANFISLLLVKYAEGAIYMVVVRALVTPLGTLFWAFFQVEPSFSWHPHFSITTVFVLVGLAIMVPAIIIYNVFSVQDQEEEYLRILRQDQELGE